MFKMTDENMNSLFTHIENNSDMRLFVQNGEIILYFSDTIPGDEVEEWQNTEPRPEYPLGIIDVIPYSDAPAKVVVYEDGGLISGYSADEPVEFCEVVWDKDDRANYHNGNADGDHNILLTFIGKFRREAAILPPDMAIISPEEVEFIHTLAHQHYDGMADDE